MEALFKNPETLLYAILGGAVPAILWLWFWLKGEDDTDDPEPRGLIALCFIIGAIMVIGAIWLEKLSLPYLGERTMQIIAWASIEEILKLIGVALIVFGNSNLDRPIDYPMYFIAVALGFAAFENVLYLIQPLETSGTIVGMMTGNLRFLGSTLLHAIASAMIGSALGLSFYTQRYRSFYLFFGLLCAIVLHSIFNFFIMKGSGENFLSVFGFLWVVAIINILIFEKLKRMSSADSIS
ncbi:MAG: PrsW family intramembrane metalloprotease [Candidatus Pacebacteria bacterium]|jgi:RsiW-degrading membrane proteinase PrsW (M82 family)|nr:PrsW family intramembrane metalloprotease [Candidatus Paceibacterota bacterium]MBP9819088.1 PrsW family intramembrane metalloprotease [Candidatus Paceibacterota bacterium]